MVFWGRLAGSWGTGLYFEGPENSAPKSPKGDFLFINKIKINLPDMVLKPPLEIAPLRQGGLGAVRDQECSAKGKYNYF